MNSPESNSIVTTDFHFKNQQHKYQGKVRDVYDIGDQLIIVATDRISAFDHILSRPIPYKGQVLNLIASHFLNAVRDICPVWLDNTPDPNVSIGKKCSAIPIEMVIRGYLTGHAWRTYNSGLRSLCGEALEDGMIENQKFEKPIITPTTKATEGHDLDISILQLKELNIISNAQLDQMIDYSHQLFKRGTKLAADQGLILVDTKYEFGIYDGELMLMDEIHTPDSSRYFELENYKLNLELNQPQIQLSKEFVREWLMSHGFQGKDDQLMPEMSDLFVWHVSERYIELYDKLVGKHFIKPDSSISIKDRIAQNLSNYF
ncbi:MAG: phosphoribosylaminoimidazolesuccinocarboxamide synthase [Saprospiraceae bacterium]|nr:phosphoribosylaminoimidazolesuccinocarboxamide synthase [Saprospiraceae bacterium]